MARAEFHWDDPLLLEEQLSDEEKMLRDAAREYAQGSLAPRVLEAFRTSTPIRRYSARWVISGFWARPFPRNTAAADSAT